MTEEEPPEPVEIYGKSKWEGEKILLSAPDKVHSVIFRCPTIMDEGRLGLLAILYEFVDDNKKLWLVGNGETDISSSMRRISPAPVSSRWIMMKAMFSTSVQTM